MKADELLISVKELPWQKPISACRSRLNEGLGDYALMQSHRKLRSGWIHSSQSFFFRALE
jgi:hypothetical protein